MSAINNSEFVENSIKKMLAACTILGWDHHPRVMNPLSVSIDSPGKKHLILDLRCVMCIPKKIRSNLIIGSVSRSSK